MQKNFIKIIISAVIVFCVSTAILTAETQGFNTHSINIIQLTDVHVDTKTKTYSKRMLKESVNLFKDAVWQINNLKDIDLVVFSGDAINRSSKHDFLKFLEIANKLKVKWLYAPGNHDSVMTESLSKSEIKKHFDINLPESNKNYIYYSYVPDSDNKFLLIFMDGVIRKKITANGYFPDFELKWLDNQLKTNPDKKVVIIQHYPLIEPYKSSSHYVLNTEEYFKVIDKYPNVIAVLSGHYHAAKITQRKNTVHISTPALVEYPNAFRLIKIKSAGNKTEFDIKLIETNLKKIQEKSKKYSGSTDLEAGRPQDRNSLIIIKK